MATPPKILAKKFLTAWIALETAFLMASQIFFRVSPTPSIEMVVAAAWPDWPPKDSRDGVMLEALRPRRRV
ncbi:hypothetical protein D3C87_1844920 [compost metagenome]